MNIAIIPAKKKSTRIKNKNIKLFNGKPIIYWTIKAALDSKVFDKIIVSTDSTKIRKIAKKYGAEAPFLRPKNLTGDLIPIKPVICHAIKYIEKKNIHINNICCLFPASPFIKKKNIQNGLKMITKNKKINFVFVAQEIEKKYSRSFYLQQNKLNISNKKFENFNTQKIPKIFIDAGQFYWANKKNWFNKTIFSKNSKFIKIFSKESVDIDTNEDWRNAIIMEKKLKKNVKFY
jgi:pseudaminic acid cytidylyltransferase